MSDELTEKDLILFEGYLLDAPPEIKRIAFCLMKGRIEKFNRDNILNKKPEDVFEFYEARPNAALKALGCKTVGDLVSLSEWDVLSLNNIGRKTLNDLKEALAERGLRFGMRFND